VVSVDVVWTAEFAAKGWLHPLKDSFALDTGPLLRLVGGALALLVLAAGAGVVAAWRSRPTHSG
jgi:hypothetical protein